MRGISLTKIDLWQSNRIAFGTLIALSAATTLTRSPIPAAGMAVTGVLAALLGVLLALNFHGATNRVAERVRTRSFPGGARAQRSVRWWRLIGWEFSVLGALGTVAGVILLIKLG